MQTSYTGSEQERWFFLIHWQIEMQSVPAIRVCEYVQIEIYSFLSLTQISKERANT